MGYVEERIQPRRAWYDRRAVAAKRIRFGIDIGTTVGSIALVTLAHVDWFPRLGLSILAAAVAVAIGVEKVGAYGEKWVLYRLAYEALDTEVQLFSHRAGPYATESNPDRLLVERTETMLQLEAGRWRALSRPEELAFERKVGG